MAIARTNDEPKPDMLLSAVLHLMSHYAAHCQQSGPCLQRAQIIERHLSALAARPDLAPLLRATCAQLAEQWSSVVASAMPTVHKRGLLQRFVAGARH